MVVLLETLLKSSEKVVCSKRSEAIEPIKNLQTSHTLYEGRKAAKTFLMIIHLQRECALMFNVDALEWIGKREKKSHECIFPFPCDFFNKIRVTSI